MEPLTEQRIREIMREEMQMNYMSGSPQIPPHHHNDTDNLAIDPADLRGFTAIPTTPSKFQNPDGTYQYGFGFSGQLVPASSTNGEQFVLNDKVAQYPIPVVVGNGRVSGEPQGEFQGGYAPEGTMVAFPNGVSLDLYVRYDGRWYGANFSDIIT